MFISIYTLVVSKLISVMAVDNEKKRSTPDSLNSPHAKKLKPMQELSESGPLTQADVVYFQKEAIWRQMIQYKQQMMSMRLELIRLQRESDALKHIDRKSVV